MKRIVLNIGDVVVSGEPAVLETVLGSCVSICLWDGQSKVGGMNHFLLPHLLEGIKDPAFCAPGSVQNLIRNVLEIGAEIPNLRAKIFGGGRVIREFHENLDVGKENVRVAKELLNEYNIPVAGGFTGNSHGIKVVFYSATGKVFVRNIEETGN